MWLDRLVDAAQARVEEGYYRRRPGAFVSEAPASLAENVREERPAIVAEVKRARPSGDAWDVDAGRQARAYASGGASGVSVLTDPDHFDGNLSHLFQARSAGLPLLMKDFLVSEEQIQAGRAWGASAVLVIARLSREGYIEPTVEDLVEAAHEAGLEALVEVVTLDELDTALEAGADIVGINQRDLDTLEHDPGRTRRLLEARSPSCPVLHLSGIQDKSDVKDALASGADGVLVGTAAMEAKDPAGFVASLKEVAS